MPNLIAGADEVGRGPLAGDVVAAAVILDEPIEGLKDSKKLSEKKRNYFAELIQAKARCYAYGRASVEEIDALNIHHATLLAMQRAIEGLSITPEKALVDGKYLPKLLMPAEAIIGGDDKFDEIRAASILAKVCRDQEMYDLDVRYPEYGFAKHKGYPTKIHLEALRQHGPTQIHRKSFAPIRDMR